MDGRLSQAEPIRSQVRSISFVSVIVSTVRGANNIVSDIFCTIDATCYMCHMICAINTRSAMLDAWVDSSPHGETKRMSFV